MPQVHTNGIQIEYDAVGDPSHPPLLLIMGLGRQMVHWPEGFVDGLVERGHYVIRFDNRDVGHSTHLTHLGPPRVLDALDALRSGEPYTPPYTLEDMADDAAAVLDALDLETAHVAGASLGGMIAQVFALRYGGRTRSMTSLMSTTGDRNLPQPTPEAAARLLAAPATTREDYQEQTIANFRIFNPVIPMDEAWIRESAGLGWDRGHNPAGVGRQYLAAACGPDRTQALGSLTMPTLVVHGRVDPLIPFEHGEATAAAIPGATFVPIDGWGHGLPEQVWPTIIDALSTTVAAGEAARVGA